MVDSFGASVTAATCCSISADPVLDVQKLTKWYRFGHLGHRRVKAVDGMSFSVGQGDVFGFLGPNGSGKTTTLKLILDLVHADAGCITVLGLPHRDRGWRERAGYLPERPYFYDYLTASEYLDYVGRLHGLAAGVRRARAAALLDRLGLAQAAHVSLGRYSKGMVQRLGLAQALIHDPELLFLDEPMSGLDPLGRRLVREEILALKRAGKTVFFSTHILSDAEALCDRVALVRAGGVVRQGRLDEILQLDVAHVEVLAAGLAADAWEPLRVQLSACHVMGERRRLEVEEARLGDLLTELTQRGARILAVQPVRQSLEDLFFREMGAGEERRGWMLDD
jgi:ABC-2 type transport system ATP-binding protein